MGKAIFPKVGERLKKIRGSMPQHEFANLLGIKHQQQYGRYEKGYVRPPLAVLEKAAKYGKVSIEWILTETEIEEEPSPIDYYEEQFNKLYALWNNLNVIPAGAIAKEEFVILKVFRLLPSSEKCKLLQLMLDVLSANKDSIYMGKYDAVQMEELEKIVRGKCTFAPGLDYEAVLYGFNLLHAGKRSSQKK